MSVKYGYSKPVVFISHSHRDRHTATELQEIVTEHGASTFLDQEQIAPGAELTKTIRDLIAKCNTFLLIWSRSAAMSAWVDKEWKLAYELKKKIIPYCLDSTPFPAEIEDLVYIESNDQNLGNSQLLTTIFGERFTPDPNTLFPGHWQAVANTGAMEATYELNLRKNGQVEGNVRLSNSIIQDPLLSDVMKIAIPINGSWTYDRVAKNLKMVFDSQSFGSYSYPSETVIIHATGHEKGEIQGKDIAGRIWTFRRADGYYLSSEEDGKLLLLRSQLQKMFDQTQELIEKKESKVKEFPFNLVALFVIGFGEQQSCTSIPKSMLSSFLRGEEGAYDNFVNWLKQQGIVSKYLKTEPTKPVQRPKVQPKQEDFTEILPGGVKLEMVAIRGGEFMMGSNNTDNEKPVHKVILNPFFIGKYEVTQAQWKAVMGKNPSRFKGDDLPVEQVSWNDAQDFCEKLSEMTSSEYRLPSEAEWEYAARADSTDDYCFGDDESLLNAYAWYGEDWQKGHTHPVGKLKPNAWGLYDCHGNVFEWCEDVGHKDYNGAPTDGSAWVTGGNQKLRLLRGGSWGDFGDVCRSAARSFNDPGSGFDGLGFRVVVSERT